MQFEQTIKRISPKLKAIAYRLNGRSFAFNEQDLYQEAIVHLWSDFQAGRLEDKTDSYLLQGCYFHLQNYIRSKTRKVRLLSLQRRNNAEEKTDLNEFLIADNFDKSIYLDYLNDKFLVEVIRNNGLSPKEKEVINFYAYGLTTRQIGARLGVSHVMVVKMTKIIREKCRKYLDKI